MRISRVAVDNETAEKGLAQYQADLVRLDRWQINLDQKEQRLHQRAPELDQCSEQMQRDLRDLEGQIFQVDAREEQIWRRNSGKPSNGGNSMSARAVSMNGQRRSKASR